MDIKYQDSLVDRFMRFTAISSQSDMYAGVIPSSEGQMELAKVLKSELEQMGLQDIKLTEQAILTARLKGANSNAPKVGFITHLDTFDGGFSPNIKAQIKKFEEKNLVLNEKENIVLSIVENPEILQYEGQDILVSDGTSVLGADDKAAVSVVMEALHYLITEKPEHGDIIVAFVPDEEIGLLGAKAMDISDFPVDYAYTLDCCELGEVVWENVNSGRCVIDIEGVVAHSMSTKGDRVNPSNVAIDILNKIERKENPAPREGIFTIREMTGKTRTAQIKLAIADFDKEAFESRKAFIRKCVEEVQLQHPTAKIECSIEDFYLNMKDGIPGGENHHSVQLILNGMKKIGVTPKPIAMRGGTDGSCISHRGIPTPNYFTGAHNFHSNFEFLPIPSFVKALELTLQIIKDSNKGE